MSGNTIWGDEPNLQRLIGRLRADDRVPLDREAHRSALILYERLRAAWLRERGPAHGSRGEAPDPGRLTGMSAQERKVLEALEGKGEALDLLVGLLCGARAVPLGWLSTALGIGTTILADAADVAADILEDAGLCEEAARLSEAARPYGDELSL